MSKYPNKIDSSVEIPIVRNNITEISADIINKLRDAILNIERAVGVNPQGELSSLSSRISTSIDSQGNIKPSAISNLNIISGKVSNSDVSESARIDESKINLNFSTQYLQTQISIVRSLIDNLILSLEAIKSGSEIHFNLDSTSQHNAVQINVLESQLETSNSASRSLSNLNLQETLQEIYSGHINFSSTAVNSINRAHDASQIYYENQSISTSVDLNVKSAIDYLLGINSYDFSNLFSDFSKNGIFLEGNRYDEFDGEYGRILYDGGISFSQNIKNPFDVTILDSSVAMPDLEVGDVIKITSSGSLVEYFLNIVSIDYLNATTKTVRRVTVSGEMPEPYSSGTTGVIYKALRGSYNANGLNLSVRPSSSSNAGTVLVAGNPNAATIISSGFKAPGTVSILQIEFEGGVVSVDLMTTVPNTIDSIIFKLNLHFADNHIPIMASKVKVFGCEELCISHMLKNSPELSKKPYLKIISAQNSVGFSNYINKTVFGSNKNSFIINGTVIEDAFNLVDISDLLSFSSGNNFLTINTQDKESCGIKEHDFIYIEQDGAFLGLFKAESLLASEIILSNPYTFSFDKDSGTKIFSLKSSFFTDTSRIESSLLNSGNRSFLYKIYMMNSGNMSAIKAAEIFGDSVSPDNANFSSQIRVLDISEGVEKGVVGKIRYSTDKYLSIIFPNGATSLPVYAGFSGEYKVALPDGNGFILVEVITSQSLSTAGFELDFEIFNNKIDSALELASASFSNFLGYYYDSGYYGDTRVSSVLDKRDFGYVGSKQISSEFYKNYLDLPRSEINANIVTVGFDILSESASQIEIGRGLAYINGSRVYFKGKTIQVPGLQTSRHKNVIILKTDGCMDVITIEGSLPSTLQKTVLPLFYQDYSSRNNSNDFSNIADTAVPSGIFKKLFKYAGEYQNKTSSILVGNTGEFRTIKEAVEFLKKQKYLYEDFIDSCVIKLQSQDHILEEPIVIGDFDIRFEGVGENCKISLSSTLANQWSNISDAALGLNPYVSMFITTSNLSHSITNIYFNNIKFNYSTIVEGVFCVNIIYANDKSATKFFTKFSDCQFIGSETSDNSADAAVGNGKNFIIPVVMIPKVVDPSSPNIYRGATLTIKDCYFQKIGSYSAADQSDQGSIVSIVISSSWSGLQVAAINLNDITIKDCRLANCVGNSDYFKYINLGYGVTSFGGAIPTRNFVVKDCFFYDE
jgi:hypothetical protein